MQYIHPLLLLVDPDRNTGRQLFLKGDITMRTMKLISSVVSAFFILFLFNPTVHSLKLLNMHSHFSHLVPGEPVLLRVRRQGGEIEVGLIPEPKCLPVIRE